MPADFFIDPQLRMVFSKAVGVLGLTEALDHMDRLQSHPDFRPEFNQYLDLREVSAITLTHEEIRQLAKRSVFSAQSRRAFVVSADWQFGISRVFGTYRELEGEAGVLAFREMSEALSWLSLAAEPDPARFARFNPASEGA